MKILIRSHLVTLTINVINKQISTIPNIIAIDPLIYTSLRSLNFILFKICSAIYPFDSAFNIF